MLLNGQFVSQAYKIAKPKLSNADVLCLSELYLKQNRKVTSGHRDIKKKKKKK